ncbi:hypothetical protein [Deinococcus humi]|uniref:Uncharacterized protein n=1 Tax=Deinococcus humi TaxID=662880 RepID=A0A7W8NI16_9DEIO|nr:hypothetical protein [Deinococcus humi]MBB5364607.1 hypothetical protein [Deinococcus humi]GGO39207.1 hypothetical protein GCM10008949_46940 [Deinococcus humi]
MVSNLPLQRLLLLTLTGLLASCGTSPLQSVPVPNALGVMELTFTGLGTSHVSATVEPLGVLRPQDTTALASGIQLRSVATSAFDVGPRGAGGQRYLSATFEVRNASADGTAYSTVRQNLTFFAANRVSNLSGTAVTKLVRFDNTDADPAIALNMLPTHGMQFSPTLNNVIVDPQAADFQAFRETEVDASTFTPASTVALFPYGFVVRNASGTGRDLPGNPTPEQFNGRVTFAYRLPLQSAADADPYQVRILVQAADTSLVRVTESLEEQSTAAAQTPAQRAAALGGAEVATFKGSTYSGANAVPLCQVRTAGTSAAPTAFLGGPC